MSELFILLSINPKYNSTCFPRLSTFTYKHCFKIQDSNPHPWRSKLFFRFSIQNWILELKPFLHITPSYNIEIRYNMLRHLLISISSNVCIENLKRKRANKIDLPRQGFEPQIFGQFVYILLTIWDQSYVLVNWWTNLMKNNLYVMLRSGQARPKKQIKLSSS